MSSWYFHLRQIPPAGDGQNGQDGLNGKRRRVLEKRRRFFGEKAAGFGEKAAGFWQKAVGFIRCP